jgi:hypothetical protein
MFLHKENQQLLWQTLQKTPYLIEFTQKFAGHREEWFCSVLEHFFTQWISKNGNIPTNARELLDINKHALQFMVTDLKRVLGYQSTNTASPVGILSPYNVAEERKRKEDSWSTNFNQYQSEYNQLLKKPALPVRELPSTTSDEKIKNMEELLKEHEKMRDMDLTIYMPAKPVTKLNIMDEITPSETDTFSGQMNISSGQTDTFSGQMDTFSGQESENSRKTVRFSTLDEYSFASH